MSAIADKSTRDKAVKALARYLKSGPVIDEVELAKIWKALFYCMWHADKPAVQNELAEKLGGLVHAMPGSRAALFNKAFWAMMMREWPGIDRLRCAPPTLRPRLPRCGLWPTLLHRPATPEYVGHSAPPRGRLNKYYTLLKCMLRSSVRQLRQAGWPAGGAQKLAAVLWEGPLSRAAPVGLRYWLVDNLVPALRAELAADTESEVLMALLEPLVLALGAAAGRKWRLSLACLPACLRGAARGISARPGGCRGAGRAHRPPERRAAGAAWRAALAFGARLRAAGPEDDERSRSQPLGDAPDAHSLQRTTEGLVEPLLETAEDSAEGAAAEEAAAEGAPPPLRVELPLLAERLFSLASDKRTREANRKQLYALQQKVEAKAGPNRAAAAPPIKAAAAPPPAAGKAAAAPRADHEQVLALRKLIGAKAGKAAPPTKLKKKKKRTEEPEAEAAEAEAPVAKAPKTGKLLAKAGKKKQKP